MLDRTSNGLPFRVTIACLYTFCTFCDSISSTNEHFTEMFTGETVINVICTNVWCKVLLLLHCSRLILSPWCTDLMYEVQTDHAALTEGFVTRITSVWLRTCANLEILISAVEVWFYFVSVSYDTRRRWLTAAHFKEKHESCNFYLYLSITTLSTQDCLLSVSIIYVLSITRKMLQLAST